MLSYVTTCVKSRYGPCTANATEDTTHFVIKAALKDFERFPEAAKSICLAALTIAAEGGKADLAKPMHGLGSGVFEIALPLRGNAFRVVYAVQLTEEIWVIHAFQKKSKRGIKTPQREIDL
jgi:phage-related protein